MAPSFMSSEVRKRQCRNKKGGLMAPFLQVKINLLLPRTLCIASSLTLRYKDSVRNLGAVIALYSAILF